MSSEPTEQDVKYAKATSERLSAIIQFGFDTNKSIPPMPPYPAIPLKNLEQLTHDSEALVHSVIVYCKQLKRHAEAKGLEAGALVSALASMDVHEVALSFQREEPLGIDKAKIRGAFK